MDVLGYEEDFSQQGEPVQGISSESNSSSQEYGCEVINYPLPSLGYGTHPPFPRDITLFHSKGGMVLRPSYPSQADSSLLFSPQQFHVALQRQTSTSLNRSRPDVVLHGGPTKASAIISSARFYPITQVTDMILCPPAKSGLCPAPVTNFSLPRSPSVYELEDRIRRSRFKFEQLITTGGLFTPEKFEFGCTPPWGITQEKFEWRHASGLLGRTIGGHGGTLKLIRVSTGDVLAVYAGLGKMGKKRNPSHLIGMFRFLPGEGTIGLGEDWEVLAVMSILSLVERGRR